MILAALSASLAASIVSLFTTNEDYVMVGTLVGMFLGLWAMAKVYEKLQFIKMEMKLRKLESDDEM